MIYRLHRRDSWTGWSASFSVELPTLHHVVPTVVRGAAEHRFVVLTDRTGKTIKLRGPAFMRGPLFVPRDGVERVPAAALWCLSVSKSSRDGEYLVGRRWAEETATFPDPYRYETSGPFVAEAKRYDYLVRAPADGEDLAAARERFDSVARYAEAVSPAFPISPAFYPVVLRSTHDEPRARNDVALVRYAELTELAQEFGMSWTASGVVARRVSSYNVGLSAVSLMARAYMSRQDPYWRFPTAGVARFLHDNGYPCSPSEPSVLEFQ
jgi:hypothetical protein